MNRDLATLVGVLLFALATAALYFGSFNDDPPPLAVATPTPARATPAPTPRPTPPPVRAARPARTPIFEATPEPSPEEEATTAILRGEVLIEDGSAPGVCDVFVTVNGKRKKHRTKTDGTFEVESPGGETSVYAGKRFGALHTRSEVVALDTSEGGSWNVTLVVEGGETGGLGIGTKSHADGIRVTRIMEGSPAEGLGLTRGDVVTEVDGMPTSGWSTTRFIAEMTGPVGSTQNFRVLHEDGREENYEFERAIVAPKGKMKLPGLDKKPAGN